MISTSFGAMTKKEAQDLWNSLTGAEQDVLLQLRAVKWDGYLNSKAGRSSLIEKGLVTKYEGYQVVNYNGLALLAQIGKLECLTRGVIE